MRLAFVSHSFPPTGRPLANLGGMQRVAVELHAALKAHPAIDLSTLVLRTSWRQTALRTGPFLFKAGWHLYRETLADTLDAVLFSSMVTAPLALPLRRTFDARGVRTAAIVHGRDVTLPFAPYQWLVPHVFGALDAALPVSRATGAACRRRGLPHEACHVVPNGLDLNRFNPPTDHAAQQALRAALGDPAHPLPEDALLLCSVGRQVERKGFAWFVDHVMPRLPEDVYYWLAGDGPEADAIRTAARRQGLEERVRLLGRVPHSTLQALYRGADLFVMPNVPVEGDMEGFGVVMLEAGRCGCPVIAARLEGIRDVITEDVNGHLVEPEQPEAFRRAILHYYHNRAALRIAGHRAARHVETTFSWEAVAGRYVQVLHALIHPPTAPVHPQVPAL